MSRACDHEWDFSGHHCVRCRVVRKRLEKRMRREHEATRCKTTFRHPETRDPCRRCGTCECPLPRAEADTVGFKHVGDSPGATWREVSNRSAAVDVAYRVCNQIVDGINRAGARADRLIVDDPNDPIEVIARESRRLAASKWGA